MGKFKIGDYVVRQERYLFEGGWRGKTGRFKVRGHRLNGNILLEGMEDHQDWNPDRFQLAFQYESKEIEELYTLGYRNG